MTEQPTPTRNAQRRSFYRGLACDMVHLIGVDHMIQHAGAMTQAKQRFVDQFAAYLESTARELSITEIAEEFSEDALDKSNRTYCTAREVATKLCIAHRFCDPTTE